MYSSSPALRIRCQASKPTNGHMVAFATGKLLVHSALLQFHTPYQDSGDETISEATKQSRKPASILSVGSHPFSRSRCCVRCLGGCFGPFEQKQFTLDD